MESKTDRIQMIKKYDNFFPPHIQTRIFGYIITSNYAIGWDDSTEVQHRAHPNLHRRFILEKDSEWWLNPILECVLPKLTDKNITKEDFKEGYFNLTKPCDINFIHNHPDCYVFLHYSNCSWNPEWGGETLFYKDNGKDVLDCNPYVPNRGVIFDGSILHTIKAQNTLGPSYRFTTSLFFNKK